MAVTVSELIEQLRALPPDLPVWTARDSEGNGFNRVHVAQQEHAADDGGRGIDVMAEEDLDEFGDEAFDVVVIW